MAKDKSLSKEERKAAKKAAKLAESNGVTKSKSTDKKEKKEKKAKKEAIAAQALSEIQKEETKKKSSSVGKDGEVVSEDDDEEDEAEVNVDESMVEAGSETKLVGGRPIGALVPFANPLADEKVGKKVFKSVKKAAAQRTLKRGVKEVVKALRKSQSSASDSTPIGIVVLAADISPMDVISHIPVLCEDHNIPYIYVTSRAELGMAGQTKRPTSVVMVSRDVNNKKGDNKKESDEEWSETYKNLVKVVEREGKHVKI